MTDSKTPEYIRKYFWDINPDKLETGEDYFIIIERLLNYADDKALKWLLKTYSTEKIKEVVKKSRRLNAKTANFWQKHFDIPGSDMRCFQKYYLKTEKKF